MDAAITRRCKPFVFKNRNNNFYDKQTDLFLSSRVQTVAETPSGRVHVDAINFNYRMVYLYDCEINVASNNTSWISYILIIPLYAFDTKITNKLIETAKLSNIRRKKTLIYIIDYISVIIILYLHINCDPRDYMLHDRQQKKLKYLSIHITVIKSDMKTNVSKNVFFFFLIYTCS